MARRAGEESGSAATLSPFRTGARAAPGSLLTDDDGHVLIDAPPQESVELILPSVGRRRPTGRSPISAP